MRDEPADLSRGRERRAPRLLSLPALLSLLLLLATLVLWVRSHFTRDIVSFGRAGGNSHTAQSILGRVHLLTYETHGRVSSETFWETERLSPNALWQGTMSGYPAVVESHAGVVWQHYVRTSFTPYWNRTMSTSATPMRLIVVPYAYPAIPLAILPTWWLMSIARRRWPRRGGPATCSVCGYDLRATPRWCPECGTAVAGAGPP